MGVPAGALARLRLRGPNDSTPYGARETLVAGWAGMRGVVTIATALALPLGIDSGAPFPNRNTIIVVGLSTVLVTLVLQGLTLAPLVRALNVGTAGHTNQEVVTLRKDAATAALHHVRDAVAAGDVPEPVQRAARLQYEGYLAAQDALDQARGRGDDGDPVGGDHAEALELLLREASEVERGVVVDARRRGRVSAEAADEVLSDVEARALRDLS